jgi:ribose transport system substrate-binding protein
MRATALFVVAMLLAPGAGAQDREVDPLVATYFERGAIEGSGIGKRIGYISLGEGDDFVRIVTQSIRQQADVAGIELIVCDSRFDPNEALVCGRQMASLGVDGILNFQVSEGDAGRICTAYGNLPTIAIDIHQPPCERSFMGADNRRAGMVTGIAVGEHLQRENGCMYDTLVAIEAEVTGLVSEQRVGGMIEGFSEVCGEVPAERLRRAVISGDYIDALENMSALLPDLREDGIHVILSINQSAAQGAADAARSLGRVDELRIGAQGVEPVKFEVACEAHWIAAAAYFPERYGNILIPAMIDLLDGQQLPPELLMPHVSVTAENIREIYDDVPDC